MNLPSLKDLNLKDEAVFLRADLNVPIKNGKILEDYKLKAILPTIKYLIDQNAKIYLGTHLGRPKLNGRDFSYTDTLSTKVFLSWFKKENIPVFFAKNALLPNNENIKENPIILLENLRFYKGEKEQDPFFAQQLSKLAKFYINDAFALTHRNDTSITLLPQLYKKENKSFGFLINQEIRELSKLKHSPEQPLVLICGGNKVKDKIPFIKAFIEKNTQNRPKSILIGGAIAYTFLHAQGHNVGKSILEKDAIQEVKDILKLASEKKVKILLPIDHVVTFESLQNKDFKTQTCASASIYNDAIGVDIGAQTISIFSDVIQKAKTIFINGTMGIYTNPNSQKGTKETLEAIANSEAFSVAGGGDATAATLLFDFADKFNYLSTGGGATLQFLSISDDDYKKLPGVKNTLF